MKKLIILFLLTATVALSACSTMNSRFSCNATAGDGCLSLDDVNAMTEGRTPAPMMKQSTKPFLKSKTKRVWIAPWADNKGVKHRGALVYVPELSEGETA